MDTSEILSIFYSTTASTSAALAAITVAIAIWLADRNGRVQILQNAKLWHSKVLFWGMFLSSICFAIVTLISTIAILSVNGIFNDELMATIIISGSLGFIFAFISTFIFINNKVNYKLNQIVENMIEKKNGD